MAEVILFREVQRLRQIWLWLIVLCAPAILIYGMIQQLILDNPFGNNPTSDTVLIILGIVLGLGLPCFMYTINLTTEVHTDGLYLKYFPFHLSFREIAFEEIKSYTAQTYSPIKDYGGWGIKFGRGGKAYNVSGNSGVQMELVNGEKLLIGSKRSEELAMAIGTGIQSKPDSQGKLTP
ncbi:MAG: DUF6141 family protein [Chloroflexota bacterium]|nr:DUF6141 family protein [Chloroflexota bacterium]